MALIDIGGLRKRSMMPLPVNGGKPHFGDARHNFVGDLARLVSVYATVGSL
jgi:hypothetical protein